MQAKQTVVGLVIAGGRSLRFGGEKAVAQLAGRPLLLWATTPSRSASSTAPPSSA